MNPTKEKVIHLLDRLPKDLGPIKDHAQKYTNRCCAIESDEILKIGHRPWVAPMNYAITLYPPIKKAWLDRFKHKFGSPIPTIYQNYLLLSNGCFMYDFELFGLPPSMQTVLPLLDRTKLQCHDLLTANQDWINGYKLNGKKFHIGGRSYSPNENVGYFIEGNSAIQAIRKNGEIIEQWDSFSEFLLAELKVSEGMMLEKTPEDWWC